MRWCICNQDDSLGCFLGPVLQEAKFESALHILRNVFATLGSHLSYKISYSSYAISEGKEFESLLRHVFYVSVADEGNSAFEIAIILTLFDNLIDYLVDSLLCFVYPHLHRASAIQQQTQLKRRLLLRVRSS